MKTKYRLISTKTDLEKITRDLNKEKSIAFDVEADSMYHFKEKVCLIQLSTKKEYFVIDPLQIQDLSSLNILFSNSDIKKIFHGADFDVRSLYRDFNIKIKNLFDTQIACMFLGIRETSLAAVIKERFKISLNKEYRKKDWSKRPLSEDMIEYAVNDTIYLIKLAKILEKELKKIDRISWVYEECEILSKVRPASLNSEPLFMKFKGAGHLTCRSLAVLEALLQFRLSTAEKKDRPLFKIIGNNSIMKIVKEKPVNKRQLEKIKALSRKQIDMYGDAIVKAANNSLTLPTADLPVYPRRKAPFLPPEVSLRAKAVKRWRDSKAKELELDPAIVCNKTIINSIAIQNPVHLKDLSKIKEMKKWQQREFGRDIVAILKNETNEAYN
ncbi:MAG: ribonuclease D [Proteobacteria bacterium]|nr:ribonuclease D [Desulfobacteraceae bacterium]MBU3979701.1 ribonuclease D [Pseudomonadota bacterium]MBU4013737.1 ribonuclease D [Pseudomonadota bacterium]MBU4068713.1 ribonuclease D [Pseudomonadota bacterium]MBU4101520.1 ribonuclease D [Pseudomonadota bacterium]